MDQELSNIKPPGRREYRRFSLRVLLAFITLLCLWLAIHVNRVVVQRDAVSVIKENGGHVTYSFEYREIASDVAQESSVPQFALDWLGVDFFHSVVEVSFLVDDSKQDDFIPAPLEQVAKLRSLKRLMLEHEQVTDENLVHISNLTSLQEFYACDVHLVSDFGVANLKRLNRLEIIQITNSQISDVSLEMFAGLPKLGKLVLQENRFSDEGLKHLVELDLYELWVGGKFQKPTNDPLNRAVEYEEITDEGLRVLSAVKTLKRLEVQSTNVTDEGVEAFNAKLPKCSVIKSM